MNGRRERRRRCSALGFRRHARRPRCRAWRNSAPCARALGRSGARMLMRSCAHARHDTASAGATANVQWHASAMHSSTETDGGRRVAPHRECDA
ncbi:hypothetical protein EYA88_13495 [Burkholderia pseudomallei]|nr:hypothetical protein EYA88_13495 [Burkholderia pseudomallei]